MITIIRKHLLNITTSLYPWFLKSEYGMDISKTAVLSYKCKLVKSINPKGIHFDSNAWVLANAVVLSLDHSRNLDTDMCAVRNCIMVINSIIPPSISIGDYVVVGSGSKVKEDITSHCVVA
jgi:acetyltransferase-like isoleucine patch superfamily enzyme